MKLAIPADRIERRLAAIHAIAPAAAERLATWSETLNQWSRAQRLVGWRTAADLLERGIADCWVDVALLDRPDLADAPIVDVGSGSGLPGLILAAAWPARAIHLVESRRKRAAFLREAARAMGASGVQVHHGRSEAFRETLGLDGPIFVSRAFAAPGDAVREAESWGAAHVVVATSDEKIGREPAWPPAGWRQSHGNSRQTQGASLHDLLQRTV